MGGFMTVGDVPGSGGGGGGGVESYATYAAALADAPTDGKEVYIESAEIHLIWSGAQGRFYPRVLSGESPRLTLASLGLASEITGLSDTDPLAAFSDLTGNGTWTPSSANATWSEAGGPNGNPCFTLASNARLNASGASLLGAIDGAAYAYGYSVTDTAGAGRKTIMEWSGPGGVANAQFLVRYEGAALDLGGFGDGQGFAKTAWSNIANGSWRGCGGQVAYADGQLRPIAGEGAGNGRHLITREPTSMGGTNNASAGASLAATIGARGNGVDPLNENVAGWLLVTSASPIPAIIQHELAVWLELLTGVQT